MISRERRIFKRVKRKVTLRYRLKIHGVELTGVAVSENISKGGVYFTSLEEVPIGAVIGCSLTASEIEGEGVWSARVVRCETIANGMITYYGIAAEFFKPHGNSEKHLQKILAE